VYDIHQLIVGSPPGHREWYARCQVYERCNRLIGLSLNENFIMFILVVFDVCEFSPLSSVLASNVVTTKRLTNFLKVPLIKWLIIQLH